MSNTKGETKLEHRRQFLRFLAGTPVLVGAGIVPLLSEKLLAADDLPVELIKAADEALNVFDFEPVAKDRMLPAHYGYTVSGTESAEWSTSAIRTSRLVSSACPGRRLSPWRRLGVRASITPKAR